MRKHFRQPIGILKRIAKRLLRSRKRTKWVLVIALLINTAFLLQLYANLFVYPNTYLGDINISGKTKDEVAGLLSSWQKLPYQMHIKQRVYTYAPSDLGALIDTDKTLHEIFLPNTLLFPFNAVSLVTAIVQPRRVNVHITFTQQFSQFIEHTVFDFSEGASDQLLVDSEDKTITYLENEEKYRMDEEHLKSLLTTRIGNNASPLYPKLSKVQNELVTQILTNSERLHNMLDQPLPVYIDASGNIKQFYLTEKELRQILNIHALGGSLDVTVNEQEFIRVINAHMKTLGYLAKNSVATPKVQEDFLGVILDRASGHNIYALRIGLDDGPNTTGDLANKYIEVDISQQRMYLFKDKKMTKTYRVSTGSEYPTPTGKFEILNKVGLGFSNIYDEWMPWWMGFSYSKELGAYFGIHELPYKLTEDTGKIQRQYGIEQPNTGGCVALSPGEAVQVYRFADIGTPVYIYD